jgi:MFS family permease
MSVPAGATAPHGALNSGYASRMSEDSYSAFSSKNFRTFLYGNVLSVVGVWIQRLALGWHAWQLSESALVVGIIAAAQFLPLILLTPFFGVLVDQVSTRGASIVMHAILAIIAAGLGVLTLTGNMTVEWLIALAFMHGLANSGYSPVRLALIPDLVNKTKFPSAVAISSMVFNISRFIGPGVAGAVVAWYGLGAAYVINSVTYLPVIFVLFILRIDKHEPHPANRKPYFAQLMEGLRYTRDHAPIRQIILLAGVSNFFGRGVLELMPAFAALIFDGGSTVLAALMAAAGAGAILASLVFSSRAIHSHMHWLVVIGAIGVGFSIILFGTVRDLPVGVVVVAMLGFFASLVSIGSQTEVQIHVENRLRGRVMSLWTLTIMGGPAIGSVVAGAMAGDIGSSYTSFVFAAICLALIALVGIRKPAPPPISENA